MGLRHSHLKRRHCKMCNGPCRCMTTPILWALICGLLGLIAWLKRDLIDWFDVSLLLLAVIWLNTAILDFAMAARLRVIRLRATAFALTAAGLDLLISGLLLTSAVFELWTTPLWMFVLLIAVHQAAANQAKFGMHVRLVLPAAAVVEQTRDS